MTNKSETMLIMGKSTDRRYAKVDLVYYGPPPVDLYIFPKEGWHLLARTGYFDWRGKPWQDTQFERIYVAKSYEEAINKVLRSYSKVESLFDKTIDKLIANSNISNFTILFNYKEALNETVR